MLTDYWPLFGIRLRTPRLELRVPDPDDLAALAAVAAAGVHDPAHMPFVTPWTDSAPEERARGTLQWLWAGWGRWSPDDWTLQFVTLCDGQVVGTQALDARNFAVLREVGGRRLRLDRAGWAAARTTEVRIEGLEPCLPMFGLDAGM